MACPKRKGVSNFNDVEQAIVEAGVIEYVLERPGATVLDVRDAFNISERYAKAILQKNTLNWWHDRLRRVPTFNLSSLKCNTKQFVMPCAPWRVAHCDTTIVGVAVRYRENVRTAELLRVGVITDGLTGFTCASVLTPDFDLASMIRAEWERANRWEAYVLDHRPETIRAEVFIRHHQRAMIRAVVGTLWDNTKVERVNAVLKRFLAKERIRDYVKRSTLENAVRTFIQYHNTTTGTRGITPKVRLQKIARQWTTDELRGLARERGREIETTTPFWPSEDHGKEPWAIVCTDTKGADEAGVLAKFAEGNDVGFYWAMESSKGAVELDRKST